MSDAVGATPLLADHQMPLDLMFSRSVPAAPFRHCVSSASVFESEAKAFESSLPTIKSATAVEGCGLRPCIVSFGKTKVQVDERRFRDVLRAAKDEKFVSAARLTDLLRK